jgi:putative Holliday junction resolvase
MARAIGLDVGSKRIGVAVSDELKVIASPHGMIRRQSYNKDAAAIAALVEELGADCVVVGLPLGLSGNPTQQTTRAQQFADMLAGRLQVPVEQWDERLSTVAAREVAPGGSAARRAGRVDAVAAALILQGFLDHQSRSP